MGALANLNPLDKVIFHASNLILARRPARTLFIIYAVGIHIMLFLCISGSAMECVDPFPFAGARGADECRPAPTSCGKVGLPSFRRRERGALYRVLSTCIPSSRMHTLEPESSSLDQPAGLATPRHPTRRGPARTTDAGHHRGRGRACGS